MNLFSFSRFPLAVLCNFGVSTLILSLVFRFNFLLDFVLVIFFILFKLFQFSSNFFTDCAAHIGHQFLHIKEGDGNARALKTVENIGGAVWQGGGSTMLAVSLLAFSDAYTYQTFFKVFTIVIIFALFFGTFFLPVVLSIFSPKPYETEIQNEDTELSNLEKSEVSELIKANDKIKSNCDINEISKLTGSN